MIRSPSNSSHRTVFPSPLAGEGGAKRRMRGTGEAGTCGTTLTRPFGAPSPIKGEGKMVHGAGQ